MMTIRGGTAPNTRDNEVHDITEPTSETLLTLRVISTVITKDSDVHANVPDHIEDGEEESLVVVRSSGGDVSRSQAC